ncbi:MAG: NAD(P)-dependent alcohol dehydrogenase [Oscillospiraceae bacterium]|nr:NAD(P)-dependent alcohol dehydrogenase [Oscillospiraceae bacterium]
MKIQAAVVHDKGGAFVLEDAELAPPRADEALIKVVACGFCGTDEIARNGMFPTPYPAVFGHEGCGVVEETNIPGVAVGDYVGFSYGSCGECERCRTARPYGCERNRELNFGGVHFDGTRRISQNGAALSTFFGQSAFATRAVVHKNNLYPIPGDMDPRIAAPLGCGVQTGAGAVMNYLRPAAGSAILITGCGVVGLSAVMAAKIAGCREIICVDRVAERLELAKELGATRVIDSSKIPEYDAEAKRVTGGLGPDYTIDCTGVGACVRRSLRAVRSLGVCVMLGSTGEVLLHGEEELMGVGKTLVGLVEGCSIPRVFIPKLIDYYRQGRFPFDRLITFYDFAEINRARDDMLAGRTLKPVLVM